MLAVIAAVVGMVSGDLLFLEVILNQLVLLEIIVEEVIIILI